MEPLATMVDSSEAESLPVADGAEDVSKQEEESSLVEADVPKKKLCGVCNENEPKYKCTRCYLPYCSVTCSTVHKATHPAIEPKQTEETKPESKPQAKGAAPRPGTVAAAGFKGPFAALDDSKELQTLFKLYPQLPSLLDEINTATLRPLSDIDELPSHGFSKGKKEESWTFDKGLEKGREALNRAKNSDGKDAEGVREFCKLVLQILSGQAGISAVEMIDREIKEENSKIIEALLKGEL